MEGLEGRRLLSGNVTAIFDATSNTVVVRGDNQSNDILIAPGIINGYTITGRNGTTVNGAASADVVVGSANFAIDMGNGDDVVELANYIVNNLAIRAGNGSDTVKLNVGADGNLNIDTGKGDDDVVLTDVGVGGNLTIDTGNGSDSMTFAALGPGGNEVFGNTDIDGGRGADALAGIATLDTFGTQTIVDVETVG